MSYDDEGVDEAGWEANDRAAHEAEKPTPDSPYDLPPIVTTPLVSPGTALVGNFASSDLEHNEWVKVVSITHENDQNNALLRDSWATAPHDLVASVRQSRFPASAALAFLLAWDDPSDIATVAGELLAALVLADLDELAGDGDE